MPNRQLPPPASQPTHNVVVRRHRIPARDGVRLFVTAWRPVGDGPFPAIINYDPYRSSDSRTLARGNIFHYLARHGYVALHLGVRGTDGSEGVVADEYAPQEQEDGYDAVEWTAAQPWCTGSVGMFGTSYSGFTCIQVAMHRPPHLKAIVPVYATDDRYTDDVHYPGGAMFTLCDLTAYATSMVCMNALPPHESLESELAGIWQAHLEGDEPYQLTWLAHQTDDDYWRHASLRPGYERIQAATFMIGGWMDGYKNSALRMLQHLSAPKKALIGPWGHIFPEWGTPGPRINSMGQIIRWYDHWLKGLDTGILDEPALTAYMQQYDPPHRSRQFTSGYWRAEPAFPAAGASEQTLHLTPDGALAPAPSAPGSHSFEYRVTVGSTNRSWSGDPWIGCSEDQRPDEVFALVYTSAPLAEPLEILGFVHARLSFSSTAPVVNVVCKLSDVAADGGSALITWGVLNATHRESHRDPSPLVPGERYDLDVMMDGAAWRFEAGHRLRLAVSGSDWPNVWPSPFPAVNTLWLGDAGGSRLALPVVPPGRPEDAPVFGDPAMPLDLYVSHAPPRELRYTRDPARDGARFEMVTRNHGRLPDEDVELAVESTGVFEVSDRDPARARMTDEHVMTVTRHGTPTSAHVHASLESTTSTFHVTFDLRVTVGEAERFRRQWSRSYSRHLI